MVPFRSLATGAPMDRGTGEGKACKPRMRCDAPTPFIRPVKKPARAVESAQILEGDSLFSDHSIQLT